MHHALDILKLFDGCSVLSHRANPNDRGKSNGWTPLHAAALYEHVEVSRLLLQYKADVYAHDDIGRTPLRVAVQYEHVNVLVARLLLEHGDVNARDNSRDTSLHLASDRGHLDVARLLVEHGANIDAEDDKCRTAFQVASERGHHDFAKFLSDHDFISRLYSTIRF
jgi:ankyrin repeat protein